MKIPKALNGRDTLFTAGVHWNICVPATIIFTCRRIYVRPIDFTYIFPNDLCTDHESIVF